MLRTVDTATIEQTNQLLYSTAVVVTEELGYKIQSNRTPTQEVEGGRKLPGASQEWHTAKQKNNSNTNKQVPSGK